MSEQWYYRSFGQDFGPVPFDQLQELAASESIGATDEVRRADSADWVLASTVPELGFATAKAGNPVAAAPTGANEWYCLLCGQEMGPLSFDEIVAFAEQGQLSRDDQVKLGSNGNWRRVGSIGRLVAVLPYQPAEQTIPQKKSAAEIATIAPKVAPSPSSANVDTLRVPAAKPTEPAAASPRPSSPSIPVPPEAPKAIEPDRASPPPVRSASPAGFSSTPQPARPTVPPRPLATPSRNSSGTSFVRSLMIPGAIAGGVLLLAGLIYVAWSSFPQASTSDVECYTQLKKFLDDLRSARASSSIDSSAFKRRAQQFSADFIPLLKDADASKPARQNLLWAVRDELPKMMASDLKKETNEEKRFVSRLEEAADKLGIK